MGAEIAVVQQAKPVVGAYRSIGRAEARQPRERRFEIFGLVAEMRARAAPLLPPLKGRAIAFGSERAAIDSLSPEGRGMG
jgi:hypothetical protein